MSGTDARAGQDTPHGYPSERPTLRAWLEPRLGTAPQELAAAIRSCVDRSGAPPDASVPDALAAAAVTALDRVMAGPQSREAALRLLAADAVLTYAFEAAAELGMDLGALADRLGPTGSLGRRLTEVAAGESDEP